jgi:hypothetical protein
MEHEDLHYRPLDELEKKFTCYQDGRLHWIKIAYSIINEYGDLVSIVFERNVAECPFCDYRWKVDGMD